MIEITSYVLGMLTIAAALLLIALVAGMVKINKTSKQLLQIEKQIDEIHHMTSHEHEHFQQQLERTCRDINMVEKTVMNQIEKLIEIIIQSKMQFIEKLIKQNHTLIQELIR